MYEVRGAGILPDNDELHGRFMEEKDALAFASEKANELDKPVRVVTAGRYGTTSQTVKPEGDG